MVAFLFVMACVALLVGLIALVAGRVRWRTGRQQGPRRCGSRAQVGVGIHLR
jgi:hypothetical protein